MPHWAVEQIRVPMAPNSQIVMFITVAIDFLVQPKGQSGPPIRVANKKPKIRSSACSISSRLAVGLFNEINLRRGLPSTKRRLVRYTVEPPTPMLLAIFLIAGAAIHRQQNSARV